MGATGAEERRKRRTQRASEAGESEVYERAGRRYLQKIYTHEIRPDRRLGIVLRELIHLVHSATSRTASIVVDAIRDFDKPSPANFSLPLSPFAVSLLAVPEKRAA